MIKNGIRKARVYSVLRDGLWHMMVTTNHVVGKARGKELRRYGLTKNDSLVLFAVLRLKGLATPASLSRETLWEPHTVSELLTSMETRGLIKKRRDLKRRNVIRVDASEKGLEAYRGSSRGKSTQDTLSALTKEEQLQLWTLLAKVRERAMQNLGLKTPVLFPPSDPDEFLRRKSGLAGRSDVAPLRPSSSEAGQKPRRTRALKRLGIDKEPSHLL